jgi:hypothetical protein
MGMSVSEVEGLKPMRETPKEVCRAGVIIRAGSAVEATSNRASKTYKLAQH